MNDVIKIALIPIARPTFDIPLAEEVTGQVRTILKEAGVAVSGPATLVTTLEAAQAAAAELAHHPPDLLLLLQATFADSTMAMAVAQATEAPLLMWAIPEAHTGGGCGLTRCVVLIWPGTP